MRDRLFLPLADYGLIGNGQTAMLVGRDGSIDWACLPRFDDPSVFGRLLDPAVGGFWQIAPAAPAAGSSMRYVDEAAVLETTHVAPEGTIRVRDALVPFEESPGEGALIRVCECLSGRVQVLSHFEPRPDYGSTTVPLEPTGDMGLRADCRPALVLLSTVAQRQGRETFELETGDRATFVLSWAGEVPRPLDGETLIERAASWWQAWARCCLYDGPWRAQVLRSSITLKLLTHEPSGAVVAAPTTSLPESPGGEANWDYRYTWLRDASLTLYAWFATGQRAEGDRYFDWICKLVGDPAGTASGMKTMYDVDGGSDHEERELAHLAGYCGSRPVRVGNAACTQLQLDVHGQLLDAYTTLLAWGREDKLESWPRYCELADWTCAHWHEPDHGIWEIRGSKRHYVYSKVMAWVALERARSLAEREGLPGNIGRWRSTAERIRASVLEHGWNADAQAFRQSYEDDRLDAANLLIPLVGFLDPHDHRARETLRATRRELEMNGLVHRFASRPGEVTEGEGAFAATSFWLVNALVQAGEVDEAAHVFEDAVSRTVPLGLLSEEIDVTTGVLLGNFPQALSHASLISAAVNLARAGLGSAPEAGDAAPETAHLVSVARRR
jgi:GH15 family glucan-1,4-alpha-glucosidase